MAIIKLGGTVVGIRGTVGGLVYSANQSGPFARSWSKPTNPRSVRQQRGRGFMTQLGPAWQALSGAQRTAWDALAVADPEPTFNSLGEPVALSGWGYFVRCNKRRLQNLQTVLSVAPVGAEATRPASVVPLTFAVASGTPGTFTATWPVAGILATDYAVVLVGVMQSGAQLYTPNRAYWVGAVLGTLGALSLGADFAAIFGAVRPGWSVRGTFHIQRGSGLRSAAAAISAVVT